MRFTSLVAVAASIAGTHAAIAGFNSGSTFASGAAKQQSDFEAEFKTAQNLPGATCFNSFRLFTMIQGGTANTPISAIPAAIDTKTSLLLGLWASAGQANFDNEIQALQSAISQYGTAFTDLVDGISVGSEDLYRDSPTGIINKSGVGAGPDELVSYIKQLRTAIQGTSLSGALVGHVDTWTAYVNGSNNAVIEAVDFVGMDAYPYFQNTIDNSIENGNSTFFEAYDNTVAVSGGKPVWITETGWPLQGATENLAVASVANSKTYWDDVACTVLGNINTWWYVLRDAGSPDPLFGIVGADLGAPFFDLSCPAGTSGNNACGKASSSSSATSSATSSAASASAPSTTATSATASIVQTPGQDTFTTASATTSAATSVVTSAPAQSTPAGTAGEDGETTITTRITSIVTVTSCPGGCSSTVLTLKSGDTYTSPACSAEGVTSASATVGTASPSSAASSATTPATPSGSSCPANLNGEYQYPHLIVPVSKSNPDKAYGTQYNGTISPDVSTIFNFDIPASYKGLTCSLVFLFPEQKDLETSAFTFNGEGGITVTELSTPATGATTYSSVPSGMQVGSLSGVQPGNSYVVTSHECGAGLTASFEFSSTGGLDLEFFNDWNPSPLGAFITVC